jgi:hypothetical protein
MFHYMVRTASLPGLHDPDPGLCLQQTRQRVDSTSTRIASNIF